MKVTDDTLDRQEENFIDADELIVEEVSIDGMCGVDKIFLLPVKGVVGHFHHDLSRQPDTLFLSNIGS